MVLVCFCHDHRYCHRRLVGEFFAPYGVKSEELNPILIEQYKAVLKKAWQEAESCFNAMLLMSYADPLPSGANVFAMPAQRPDSLFLVFARDGIETVFRLVRVPSGVPY